MMTTEEWNDKPTGSNDGRNNEHDLIRRGDVANAIVNLAEEFLAGGSPTAVTVLNLASDRIAALPAVAASQTADPVRVTVKPLVWRQRKGRNGPEWDALCDLLKVGWTAYNEDGKRAIEAHRASLILAAIDVQPDPRDAKIAALVEALQNMIEGYEEWDLTGETLILRPIHLQTSWIQRARAALAAAKGGAA